MAEEAEHIEGELQPVDESYDPTTTPGYTPPAPKTLEEIKKLDTDDPSLEKYKEQLLGGTEGVLDEGGNNVLVKSMVFITPNREEQEIDLTGDLTKLKSSPIIVKEGVDYRIKINFRVQREIVAGLRYFQTSYRKGVKVDKTSFMVGSYGPKTDMQSYTTPKDDMPSGLIARGHYTVKSKFTDDDKNIYLEWEWSFDLKKDW